jgi:ATPase subunit of ABC transporter with duplicated ATPase domains
MSNAFLIDQPYRPLFRFTGYTVPETRTLPAMVYFKVDVQGCFSILPCPPSKKPYERIGKKMSNEPSKIIYSMIGVSKFHNKKQVLKNISLSYFYGAKIGVIGLNGSGKSSLLRILAGKDNDFNGETVLSPGHKVGILEQEPSVDEKKTVREIVQEGVKSTVDILNEYNIINEKFAEPMSDDEMSRLIERQGEVQEKLDTLEAWDLDSRLEMAMDALRCPPGDTPVSVLSGGERRRVALCRLLLQKPDILLLDEPTNHLDAETVAWLEHHLQKYPGTIIAVTHDRYFLDNVAGWILELDRGEGIPWKGNYSRRKTVCSMRRSPKANASGHCSVNLNGSRCPRRDAMQNQRHV